MMIVVTPTENLKKDLWGNRYMREMVNGITKQYTFIGDAYSAPAVIETYGGTNTPHFLLRDHLGSITHVANNSGGTEYEYSFDAWGRQRNPSTWENYPVNNEPTLFMGRGFTGHEHLPWFGLILGRETAIPRGTILSIKVRMRTEI